MTATHKFDFGYTYFYGGAWFTVEWHWQLKLDSIVGGYWYLAARVSENLLPDDDALNDDGMVYTAEELDAASDEHTQVILEATFRWDNCVHVQWNGVGWGQSDYHSCNRLRELGNLFQHLDQVASVIVGDLDNGPVSMQRS